ncbi:MAG: HDOD domain-containing protein, partial [bacterium]|nr:HDOD domain-containing protein [bacterium]
EENQEQATIDHAFMAGMLHDSGKLVLAANFSEQYLQVLDVVQRENTLLTDEESKVFGTTHAEVGGYLMDLWGLPGPIIEGLVFHHCPSKYAGKQFLPLTAVHVANALEHQDVATGEEEVNPLVDCDYLASLNLTDRIPVWMEICRNSTQGEENNE